MDPVWSTTERDYRELSSLPRNIVPHPMEEKKTVNRYFNSPKTPDDKAAYTTLLFHKTCLAILLASLLCFMRMSLTTNVMLSACTRLLRSWSVVRLNLMVEKLQCSTHHRRSFESFTISHTVLVWWILPPYSTRTVVAPRLPTPHPACWSLEQGRYA
jgi:hypothetical protein